MEEEEEILNFEFWMLDGGSAKECRPVVDLDVQGG
jgi:hypothetical protein